MNINDLTISQIGRQRAVEREGGHVIYDERDPRTRSLAAAYGKRALAAWLLQADADRRRYKKALEEIARWDEYKTIGYEGPKRVAADALAGAPFAREARP